MKINVPSKKRYRLLLSITILLLLVNIKTSSVNAQAITQPAQIAWGRYMEDTQAGFDWAKEDLGDRIYYDRNMLYIVGRTKSDTNSFVNCSGISSSGDGDAFLASYNTTCNSYNYIKYFGGPTSLDYAYCAAIDHNGDHDWIYIAGEVNETGPKTDLPIATTCSAYSCPSTFQTKSSDKKDAFIAKYDLKTGKLVRWTYFGGKGMDQILGIEVDSITHDVYFAGYTESPAWLVYANYGFTPYKGDFTGLGKAFIGGMDSCLNTLKYFTYYGGNGSDRAHDLRILYANNTQYLVVSGTTQSHSGVVPDNGNYWDNTFGGGNKDQKNPDAFLLIWNVNTLSSMPDWCSYVGGSNIDRGRGIDITTGNDIYLVSQTLCAADTVVGGKFIPTPDAYQSVGSTRYNSWVAKFHIDSFHAPLGVHLSMLTFIGGGKDDFVKSVRAFHTNNASDGSDTVVVAGLTYSNDMMSSDTSAYFLSGPINGNGKEKKRDAFIAVLTKDPANPLNKQKQSSFCYLGGEKDETDIKADTNLVQKSYNPGIALGPNGSVFIVYTTLGIKNQIDGNIPVQYSSFHCPGGNCDSGKAQPDAYFAQVYPFPQHFIPTTCTTARENNSDGFDNGNLSFYPVPFSNSTTMKIFADHANEAKVFVYDFFGKTVIEKSILLQAGINELPVNLSQQSSGMFLGRVIMDDGKSYQSKVTKE